MLAGRFSLVVFLLPRASAQRRSSGQPCRGLSRIRPRPRFRGAFGSPQEYRYRHRSFVADGRRRHYLFPYVAPGNYSITV